MKQQTVLNRNSKKSINAFKLVSVFAIIGLIFFSTSFAQDAATQKIDDLSQITHFIISFLSRSRALLAALAGKLMSNDLIYGSFLNLDTFLRKTRNIMKNFANYTLGFLFLYMIIKSIINIDGANDLIKKKISGFVVAGVLIQASRFLFGTVIDISTIGVTAISAIPGQILQSDLMLQKNLTYINAEAGVNIPAGGAGIKTGILITFNPNKELKGTNQQFITKEEIALDRPITQENYLDMILPSYNTIAGPLIFFGTSIFKFQDYSLINNLTTSSRKRLMEFGLNLMIIVIYSIAMLGLIIINFFRIFFLRIALIFSPFIILIGILGSMKIIDTSKIEGLKSISIGTIVGLIFKPVLFMAYISLMMIFVIGVKSILTPMSGGEIKLDEVTIHSKQTVDPLGNKSYDSSIKTEDIFDFSIKGAKNSISDIIIAFFTLFLLRFLLKAALTSKTGIESLDKKLEGMTKTIGNIAGQLPVVPIGQGVGINSVFGKDSNSLLNRAQTQDNIITKMSDKNEDNIGRRLGTKRYYRDSDTRDLQRILDTSTTNPNNFRNKSIEISKQLQGGLSIDNTSRNRLLQKRRETYYKTNHTNPINIGGQTLEKGTDFNNFKEINKLRINNLLNPNQ